ncbi:hypothetical protein ACFY05_23645 [Microtetraspora fusca]|uniref:MmyB-like transcription regulator ligand binding domain-containing protein n=1 Tax=Microtetraspora fusca TaxID=1997 RepID=A0ABW6V948_MICFU
MRIVEDPTTDPDFRRMWADQDVYRPMYGAKRYRHPLAGELTLGFEAFTPAGAPARRSASTPSNRVPPRKQRFARSEQQRHEQHHAGKPRP